MKALAGFLGLFLVGSSIGAQSMILTRDWLIPTNGVQLASSTNPKSPGTWIGFRFLPEMPEYLVLQTGADRPWGGLQLKVDPASGAILLFREWQIDSVSGVVKGYRDFHTAPGIPGIQWFPPTLPKDGSSIVWSQRFILDHYNWTNEQGVVSNEPFWFDAVSEAKYLGYRKDDLTGVYAISRKDSYGGGTAEEEYLLGRLPDGSTVGLYGWIAPVFNRKEIGTVIVEFKNPNAFKCLVPWQGVWSNVWLWTKAGLTWVPEQPSPATIRAPQGSPKPPYPTPSPDPAPEPLPEPPGPIPGDPVGPESVITIDRDEVERILEEEVGVLLSNLRAALRVQ